MKNKIKASFLIPDLDINMYLMKESRAFYVNFSQDVRLMDLVKESKKYGEIVKIKMFADRALIEFKEKE
jgi:hypothetical protein